jgi:hypothetical protein
VHLKRLLCNILCLIRESGGIHGKAILWTWFIGAQSPGMPGSLNLKSDNPILYFSHVFSVEVGPYR